MNDFRCEYCEGTVKEKVVKREAFKHKTGYVILEDVPIGICDHCGNRYYTATVVHVVEDVVSGKKPPARTETVPVAHA